VLAAIDRWPTAPVTFENLKSPLDLTVRVAESERFQVGVSPQEIRMRMDVQWFAEKVLSGIVVDVHSVPPHREVIVVPPRLELVVRGGVDMLSRLDPRNIQASLDYSRILSDTSGTLAPEILAPPGLQVIGTRPDRVQYIVRKRL
jgi:hypothetical protein